MKLPISVKDYYAGKTVFITGATGFMGKVLVEKILRSCPDVKRLLLLMRAKKGQSCDERLQSFLESKLFGLLKQKHPEQFEKLLVIPGDILVEGLGISDEDRELVKRETNVIFHCAACVRFDMFIKDAVNLNAVGTKRVLDLTNGMDRLEVFVHVSTAYCRSDVEVLEEKLYPSKHRPQDVMSCVEWMDDDLLRMLEPSLIKPQPNTYGYTKALAEELVSQYAGKFPIAIARPSIVTASYKEPMPGWVDNLNGPTGLMVAAGKGVARSMYCNYEYNIDAIPVDMAVNGCILLAYTTALEKPKEVNVCNVAISDNNPISWRKSLDMGKYHIKEFPYSVCLWYPGGSYKKCWYYHRLCVFFTHLLPAYFVDLLLTITGRKPFMVDLQKRIDYGINVVYYYTITKWFFKNDNYNALRTKVSEEEDETFFTDIKVVNWSDYIRNYIKGTREYCLNEDPATLPQARKLHSRLYYADLALKTLLYFLLSYIIYSCIKMFITYLSA